jgi:hypothetical protein
MRHAGSSAASPSSCYPYSREILSQKLDASWTVTVNGQTDSVSPDGSFLLANISAADFFGPAGPGSPPDLLSDSFLRLVPSTLGGVTQGIR